MLTIIDKVDSEQQNLEADSSRSNRDYLVGGTVAGGLLGYTLYTSACPDSAFAQSAPGQQAVTDVTAMMTSLATLAGVVTAVVLGAMGVRMAIKLVNRMATKG